MAAPRHSSTRAAILVSIPYSGLFHRKQGRGALFRGRNLPKTSFWKQLVFELGSKGLCSLKTQRWPPPSLGGGKMCPDFQGRYHWGEGEKSGLQFSPGVTRKEEVSMVQSPSWPIPLG